jgi:hypothetical protein
MIALHFLHTLSFFVPLIFVPIRVGLWHEGHTSKTFEACIGRGTSTICPFSFCVLGRACFLNMFNPSTTILPARESTLITLPLFPASFPVVIFTMSPFLIFMFVLHQFFGKRCDGVVSLFFYFPRKRTENPGRLRFFFILVDDNDGIVAEPDIGAVFPSQRFTLSDDQDVHDILLFDLFPGFRGLDGRHDDIADARISPLAASQNPETPYDFRTRVVRHF